MTPLHIELAIHYHCRTDQRERLNVPTVRQYAQDFVRAGMLTAEDDGFYRTDGLAVFVNALLGTPFPVKQWVMPDLSAPTAPR